MLNNSHINVYTVMDDLPSNMSINQKDNTHFSTMLLSNIFDDKGSNEVIEQATKTIEEEKESGHQAVNELEAIFTSSNEGSEPFSGNTIIVNLPQEQFHSTHSDVNKFVEPVAETTDQGNLVKHTCINCDADFISLNKYQDHLRWHKCQKKFKCTECFAGYNIENNLKIHMILNHPSEDNRSCPICNVTLTHKRAAGMKSHLMIHQVEELHSCEKCLSEFEKEDDYVKHMKSHKSEERTVQPFTCSHCHVHFENSKDYRSHISEHQKARRFFAKPKKTRKSPLPDAKKFHCKTCDKSFFKSSLLERHERIHSGEKPYKCDQCEQSFAQKGTLQTHFKKHTGTKPFLCTLCPAKFAQKGNLKVHIKKTHTFPDKADKMYKCPYCTCIFKKIAPLNGHVTKVHSNKSGAPENVLLDVMKNLKELDKQMNEKIAPISTEHGNIPEKVSKKEKIVSVLKDEYQNRGSVQEKSFVTLTESIYDGTVKKHDVQHKKVGDVHWYCCGYCPKQCKKPSDLIRHMRVHTKEKPYKCKQCTKTFTLKSTLLSHKKTHNTSFKCNKCDAGFASNKVLNNHIRDHELKKLTKWECCLCKGLFDDFEKALTHKKENGQSHVIQSVLNSVIKQPLYQTVYGNLTFKPPRPRIPNTGMESSKRQFHCTICDARFARKVNLTRHLQYHANDRKYKCHLCPKTYITACRLKEHLNYHNNIKKYGCKVCNKRFVNPTLLKRHLIIHNTGKPYMCPYCSKHFKTLLLCRHHIHIIHKKDAIPKYVGNELVTSENNSTKAPESQSELTTDSVPYDEQTPITEPMNSDATQSISCNEYLITNDGGDYQTLYVTVEDLELLKNSNLVLDSSLNSHTELLNSENLPSEHVVLDGSNVVLINSNTENNLVNTNVLEEENLLAYDIDLNIPVDDSEQIFGNDTILRTSSRFSESENIFNDANVICMNCNKVFSDFATFPKHKCEQEIANVDDTSRPEDASNEVVDQQPEGEKRKSYTCHICKEVMSSKRVLSRHLKNHPKKDSFECDICKLFLNGKTEYLEHMSSHTSYDNSHICKFCNKKFKKTSDMKRHLRVHTGEKPFGCNVCNKSFSLKSTLLAHMRTHNPNSKEYNCHICNSFYSSRSSLRVHMSVHTGQKPYSCHFCKMKFRTSANRKSHEVLKHSKKRKGTGEVKNKITDVLKSVASEMAVINCPCDTESETFSSEIIPIQNNDTAPVQGQLEGSPQIISLDVVPENMLTTIPEGQITIDSSLLLHQIQMADIVLTADAGSELSSFIFNEVNLLDLDTSGNNLHIISLPQANEENGVTISINEVEEKQERKNTVQCDICKKFYASKNVLRRHLKNLHGEKPNYSCSQCHKNFRSKVTFLRHCKTHPELILLLNQDGTEVTEESLNTDMERGQQQVDLTRDTTSSLLTMKFDLSSAAIDDPLFDSLFSIKKA